MNDAAPIDTVVRKFRQILLWPVQLLAERGGSGVLRHWELLQREHSCWQHHLLGAAARGNRRPRRNERSRLWPLKN